jgi:hypothetical protein
MSLLGGKARKLSRNALLTPFEFRIRIAHKPFIIKWLNGLLGDLRYGEIFKDFPGFECSAIKGMPSCRLFE